MGVHGLWELLAPVGRRVSVETLAGKKLAIDASIWMIQFMKAMRDEKGEMVRNAHILGFFRRICKLLYLKTKPVFVFDGGTPALKRRTVIARRRQRENAQAKIRKTAEKLLLNHLKAMRLKELAADLEKQRQENDIKGKRPITQEPNHVQHSMKGNDDMGISYDQEELDAMLAASLAVEENGDLRPDASASGGGVPSDEDFGDEEEDGDEEMILPEMHGKVDPAVLAALPPSMQLDLLVQMRERLMAENRQKYQKVKKAPARFSELQIQAYLKTVAFRREIDGVQKAAAGRGIGGVQTSRIASEANREFIFSSSFTGDKQSLTSVGQERVEVNQTQPPPVNCTTSAVNEVLSTKRSSDAAAPTAVEAGKPFHDDVETYLDERGRLRVSRGRALGIRMTRDLQRNLDLMKEFDKEKDDTNQEINNESRPASDPVNVLDNSSDRIQHQEAMNKNNDGMNHGLDKIEEPAVLNGTSIEVSFEDTLHHEDENDDDKLFASLVADDPIMNFSVDNSVSAKQSLHSSSDCEWEEGVIEDKNTAKGSMSDEGEVEWEEGSQDIQLKSLSCPDERQKAVTASALQEEVDFREAIRRSLEDTMGDNRLVNDEEEVEWEEGFQDTKMKSSPCLDGSQKAVTKGALQEQADIHEAIRRSLEDARDGISLNDSHEDDMSERARQTFSSMNILLTNCPVANAAAVIELSPDKRNMNPLNGDAGGSGTLPGERPVASDSLPEEKGLCITGEQPGDTTSEDGNGHAVNNLVGTSSVQVVYNEGFITGEQPIDTTSEDGNGHAVKKLLATSSIEEKSDDHSCPTANVGRISANDSITEVDGAKGFAKENTSNSFAVEKVEPMSNSSFVVVDDNKEHEITKDHLEKKMQSLDKIREELEKEQQELERNAESVREEMFTECQVDGKEHELMEYHLEKEMRSLDEVREELGSEQRKLERNAESVSSEMFTECQELLQMFGLPYIIAPMEAEAQCAFMELSNLVDGVVTDDSDAFLFGARSVYKNIFDDRKYVETYLMKDIEDELGLDREKLIHMALLLGSDYTEGISGIGIVNAIEVVNAFPEKDGLHEFREWIESPDPSILGKLDVEGGGNTRRKGSKDSETIMNGSSSNTEGISSDQNVPQPVDDVKRKKQIFMDKHRNVSKNWHIPSTFPSDAVISAYASPQVDKSTEPFSWGKPDLFILCKLCWDKFGWSASKADEVLLPVLKEYSKHETQLRLEAFYTFNERFAKIRSKRIKKAVKGITGHKSSELINEATPQNSRSGKKGKVKPSEDDATQSGLGSSSLDDARTSKQNNNKLTAKQLKRGLMKEKTSAMNLEQSTGADGHLMTRKESHVRGRKRGRGRGQVSGRGKRKKNSSRADTETSNADGSCNDSDEEMQFDQSEESHQVRRSERVRKTVNYTVPDELNDSDENMVSCTKEDPLTKDSFLDQEAFEVNKSDGDGLNEGGDRGMGDEFPSHEIEQEHKMENTSPKQIDDSINQSQLSQDYLQFGGGFCLDDDDNVRDFDGHASSSHTKETIPDKSNIPNSAVSVMEEDRETDLSDTENDPGISFSRSLRAMPNLRKKKRT